MLGQDSSAERVGFGLPDRGADAFLLEAQLEPTDSAEE